MASNTRRRRRIIPASRRGRLALAAILLSGLAAGVMLENWADNQSAHYDLIRALDAGRENIDAGPYPTKDEAFYKGHWFSARAPGLALFSLPFYEGLTLVDAPAAARASDALRGQNEMVDFVGWWGATLPGLILMMLLWRMGERFEPGYGAAAAVAAGLGTLLLPFSTMLFSHVFTAMLGFGAFAIMVRERDGPPRTLLLAGAGLAIGYAIGSEYPLAFTAVVLGLYMLSRPDCRRLGAMAARAGAYTGGALVGLVPLLLYNHAAFGSWTHIAYSSIPAQQQGFFGITAPRPIVAITLLFGSRGLLTVSPILLLGALGTVLLYRRGRRAEALAITAVCLCYLLYNSGYYLPMGGASPGPRFMITLLPFLACPLGLALRRYPGPTVALAGASILMIATATITHPLIGFESETVRWSRLLESGQFQPTIASAFGLGHGWEAIWPFLVALAAAVAAAGASAPPLGLDRGQLIAGGAALIGWGLFAAIAPTALGIDHQGLLSIKRSGYPSALNLARTHGARYPLATMALFAVLAGLSALAAMWAVRRRREPGPSRRRGSRPTAAPAVGPG